MDLIIFCIIGAVIVGGCIVAFTLVKQKKSGKQYGKIEPTKNIIVSIREIAELTTASFFCETAVVEQKRKKIANNLIGDFINKVGGDDMEDNIMDKLCLIASGIVRAGYDLKKIKEDDFRYIDGKLTIVLPPVEIFDVIVNPKQRDFYVDTCKDWTDEQINVVISRAKDIIRDEAMHANLLEQAAKNGEKQIRALFLGLGYKDIELLQQEQPTQCAITATMEQLAIE